MPNIQAPLWLDQIEDALLPCDVVGEAEPSGMPVEIRLNGERLGVVVPTDSVAQSPDGKQAVVRVHVLAELPTSDPLAPGQLVELPAQPLNASQRLKVKVQWLAESPAWLSRT